MPTSPDNQNVQVQTVIGPDNTGTDNINDNNNNNNSENGENEQLTTEEMDSLLRDTFTHGFCNKYDLMFIAILCSVMLAVWVWVYKQPVPFIVKRIFGLDPPVYPDEIK